MGFIEGAELGSSFDIYIFDYSCNFNGINSFNILMENINTANIDSFDKSNSSIIQSIAVDPSYPVINFIKTQSYNFNLSTNVLDHVTIGFKDNSKNYLDFNNKNWSLTLVFNVFRDVDRFAHENSFFHMMNNG